MTKEEIPKDKIVLIMWLSFMDSKYLFFPGPSLPQRTRRHEENTEHRADHINQVDGHEEAVHVVNFEASYF